MDENACPMCGSDCNERDELTKAEREIARLRDAIIEAATKQWEDQRRTLDSVARLRTETEEFIAIFGAQFDELARLRAENERLKADAVRLDSGRIALWGPGEFFDADTGHRESVQTEHSGIDLRKAIDEAIEMATPEWRAMYCVP